MFCSFFTLCGSFAIRSCIFHGLPFPYASSIGLRFRGDCIDVLINGEPARLVRQRMTVSAYAAAWKEIMDKKGIVFRCMLEAVKLIGLQNVAVRNETRAGQKYFYDAVNSLLFCALSQLTRE